MSTTNSWSPQFTARLGGLLLLLSLIGGGFGEAYVPMKIIVSGDANATAKNVLENEGLIRLGFAGYLLEALCDTGLTMIFYVLLKPAGRELALFAAFLRIVSTAAFAVAEVFFFVPLLLLHGASYLKTFSPDQLNSLAFLSFKIFGQGAAIPSAFYGVAWIVIGALMIKSGYFPKLLGALMVLAGSGFAAQNAAVLFAPAYAWDYLALPMFAGAVLLTLWLLIRGINLRKWPQKTSAGS